MSLLDGLAHSPEYLTWAVLVLGLCVGSFLNVVAWRLPQMMDRSDRDYCRTLLEGTPSATPPPAAPGARPEQRLTLSTPASHCPACKAPIKPWHNLPVFGWLALRGQCAACGIAISPRYPLVEAATGLLSAYCAWHFGWSVLLPSALAMTWALVALSLIDYDQQLLPDSITLPLLWLGLLLSLGHVFVDPKASILGAAAGYTGLRGFSALYGWIRKKEVVMGHGDFKLFAAFGAWFGLQALLPVLVLSALAGSVVGIPVQLIARTRGNKGDVFVPFGPFLALAGWLMLAWGDTLLGTWFHLTAAR